MLVRALKFRYLWKLKLCLRYPKTTCVVMAFLIGGTFCLIPQLGREFMPELEEGNLWLRGIGELNMNLDHSVGIAKQARAIMASYPEVESIITQSGRPDDGTDTEGFYSGEYFVPLRHQEDWPKVVPATGWRRWVYGPLRARTKRELVDAMNADLERDIPGVTWNFSQNIRDNVLEAMSGVKGDNSIKIFGPDIDKLELLADKAKHILQDIRGVANVGVFHVRGATHLQFRVDPLKCQKWGVTTADVNNVVTTAMAAQPQSTMVEGEKLFNIAIRWPKWRRNDETSILDIPVDIINNQVVLAQGSGFTPNAAGHALPPPAVGGSLADTSNPISSTPRLRLRDLVTPVDKNLDPEPNGSFIDAGAATIYRENGHRMIAIKFSVRGRDLGSAVDEARVKTKDLFQVPYHPVWSGEFEQMEEANGRLLWIIPLSLGLIFILLYVAFRSFLDTIVIFSNVFDVAVGGIWSLVPDRDQLQCLGGRRLRLALRDRHHGGPAADLVFQRPSCPGAAGAGRRHPGLPQAGAAGDDHRDDGHPGALARGRVDQDGRPDGAAVGHRRGRRHDRDAPPRPLPDAGALQLLRSPRAAGRGRGDGPLGPALELRGRLRPATAIQKRIARFVDTRRHARALPHSPSRKGDRRGRCIALRSDGLGRGSTDTLARHHGPVHGDGPDRPGGRRRRCAAAA